MVNAVGSEKAQESQIKEHVALLPAMWSKQERKAGR